MYPYQEKVEELKNQILAKYKPMDIILFGSFAKGLVRKNSDIDLCVIIDTNNKRQLARDMLLDVDSDFDVDIVIYTPDQWQRYKDDEATFASIINRTGVSLVG